MFSGFCLVLYFHGYFWMVSKAPFRVFLEIIVLEIWKNCQKISLEKSVCSKQTTFNQQLKTHAAKDAFLEIFQTFKTAKN